MSSSYSANQYENAFKPHKLQNWTVPARFKERPSAVEGHTTFIATDRGHLLPGMKRGSAWTSFQGTWDLPNRIPPVHINPTARSLEGRHRLGMWGQSQRQDHSVTDEPHQATRSPHDEEQPLEEPQILGGSPVQADAVLSQPATQAPSRPATQESHAESRPASQNKAASRPTSQQKQESRPLTQASHAPSRPASQSANDLAE